MHAVTQLKKLVAFVPDGPNVVLSIGRKMYIPWTISIHHWKGVCLKIVHPFHYVVYVVSQMEGVAQWN